MTNFMNAVENEILENYNVSITENGAIGYKTTGRTLLDMNFKVPSYRGEAPEEIAYDFNKAVSENPIIALKWLFFVRDIRGGLGERRFFRIAFKNFCEKNPVTGKKLIPLVPEFGRWDDLWCLLDVPTTANTVLELVEEQFKKDMRNTLAEKEVSLLAKWMPSANASSKDSKRWANMIMSYMNTTPRNYRKSLSKIRAYLDVIERKMSSGNWSEINYETVPSRANLMYKCAFMRHDEERRNAYLNALENGEAKINASVLYPHEIVHEYVPYAYAHRIKYDAALEGMWKALPDETIEDTLVVSDGSGSMSCSIPNSNASAMNVSHALAIYFAERNKGQFRNKYITFSSDPQVVTLDENASLCDKLIEAHHHTDWSNTDIRKTFELILDTAKNNNMTQEDMPKNVLVISDMEFDGACSSRPNETLFKLLAKEYEEAGYKMPRLVFWNVNSRTNTIPMRENDLGVALISGFSTNLCKMIMSNKTDPWECLLETLNTERYNIIEETLRAE